VALLLLVWLELELMEILLELEVSAPLLLCPAWLELDVSALLLLAWLELELKKGQYSLGMPPLGQSR